MWDKFLKVLDSFWQLFLSILGLGRDTTKSDDVGLYYYIKSSKTGAVVRVRINPMNDLTQRDEENGYFTNKVIHGTRGYDPIEATFYFNQDRKLTNTEIKGGTMVDKPVFDAYQASQ